MYTRMGGLVAWICLAALVASRVNATSYTFAPQNENSGYWHVSSDWSPNGRPTAADDATIPAGTTCRVTDAEACFKLTVAASGGSVGKLIIEEGTLELGDNSGITTAQTHTINGEIIFFGDAGCTLQVRDAETITGTGQIYTDPNLPAGGYGQLLWAGQNSHTVTITGSLTWRGSIRFHMSMDVGPDVKFETTQAAHEMFLGMANNFTQTSDFDGLLDISAGTVTVRRMILNGSSGEFRITGGSLVLDEFQDGFGKPINTMNNTLLLLTVCGGTTDVQLNLAGADIVFIGGTIQVESKRTAVWSP